jgi:hypothetical protein
MEGGLEHLIESTILTKASGFLATDRRMRTDQELLCTPFLSADFCYTDEQLNEIDRDDASFRAALRRGI